MGTEGENYNYLTQTDDAQVWAQAFMKIFGTRLSDIDEGLMIGWFANAIETGRNFASWHLPS